MKSGRAAKWAAWVFKWEEDHEGYSKFLDWEKFRLAFWKDFCPTHSDTAAINKLESTSYFQKACSIDNYLDEFMDLIVEAGYTDLKTMVVKFQKGLDPQIQNTIAMMAYGHPSDTSLENWYEAARTVDQNHAANEAFKMAYQTPIPATTCPTQPSLFWLPPPVIHTNPTLGNPVPMDIDVGQKKNPLPLTCYRRHKAGHKAPGLSSEVWHKGAYPRRTPDGSDGQNGLARIDNVVLEAEEVIPQDKDFLQNNEWKACPGCLAIIISKY